MPFMTQHPNDLGIFTCVLMVKSCLGLQEMMLLLSSFQITILFLS